MEVLRTPDERFEKLEGYDFAPHYMVVKGAAGTPLRMHYVDEGPRDAAPVLLLHGNPAWSFLYRNIIRALVARGHRVVAPDLVGFGRSDKPAARTDYTQDRHIAWLEEWFLRMDLRRVTLFCQDWGGLLGLHLVADHPERFAAVVAANTGLPEGQGATPGLERWLAFSQGVPALPIADLLHGGTIRGLGDAERRAYEAPFPDGRHQSAALQFPLLIPLQPDNPGVPRNKAAWKKLERFEKPFLTLFGDRDPISKGGEAALKERIPGAKGQPHRIVEAHHFIQEDQPELIIETLDGYARAAR
ncbi:MAG TPA: haloalkane dehalogenase [Myxococcota bacterium]|nr:haloalkane dehalogenase [Myxococcota bacterium]